MSSTASHHGGHATGRTFTSLLKEDSPSASCGEMVIKAEGVVNLFTLCHGHVMLSRLVELSCLLDTAAGLRAAEENTRG